MDKLAQGEYTGSWAIPVIYSDLSAQDIITKKDKDGVIQIGSDGFCTLIYEGLLFSLPSTSIIQLPDQTAPTFSGGLTAAQIAQLTSTGSVTATFTQTITFNPGINNPLIDSIVFKAANFDLQMVSDFGFAGNIQFSIPASNKNGQPFSGTMNIPYSGSVPVNNQGSYSLAGYKVDMTMGGTTSNQFQIVYNVTLTGSGPAPSLTDNVYMYQAMNAMSFSSVFGDMGQISLSPDRDTVELSIFKNALGTGIYTLVDPSVEVTISNSFGFPINASIAQLEGFNPPSSVYPITGSPNPLPIYSPNFTQIGQSLAGSYTLNASNSNIVSVINNTPKKVVYQINSISNPGGPTKQNFITDSSRFRVDMKVNLPFWGTAKDFQLQDTIDFELDTALEENVESLLFRIYNRNGFPIDVDMQAYLVDSNYVKLDSLISPNQLLLKSAAINASTGLVTTPTEKTLDIIVDNPRFKKLRNMKYVLIKASASTTNQATTDIKIYNYYSILAKLGVKANLKVKF